MISITLTAGSCNRALLQAANDRGLVEAQGARPSLPAECFAEFAALERQLGDSPVVLLKLYERVVLPAASKTLQRCSRMAATLLEAR